MHLRSMGHTAKATTRAALIALTSLAALSTFSTPAQAAFQLSNVSLQCSGNLVLQEGDAYNVGCSGDLGLQGLGGQGSFLADSSITLQASGLLSLMDMLLQAPTITLNGNMGVSTNSATKLAGLDVRLSGGTIVVDGALDARGGSSSPVPEASTTALMALGLIGMAGLMSRRARTGAGTRQPS